METVRTVFFRLGLLEAGGGRLWTEDPDNVLSLVLIQENHGHRLFKWPFQQSVILATVDGNKKGEVGALTGAMAIQIQIQTQLVSKSACEERNAVENKGFPHL